MKRKNRQSVPYPQHEGIGGNGGIAPLTLFLGVIYDTIYLSPAIGLTPGGSSTVHIYTQTIQRTT